MAFHRGDLTNLSVVNAHVCKRRESRSDDAPESAAGRDRRRRSADGRTQVATFRTNAVGYGMLTITSTGAQYVVADWIVVGI